MKHKPLWAGPEIDGVTFSLLSRFLVCRERFRLYVIEGLKPAQQFEARIEYGNMWHLCEETHAQGLPWTDHLKRYATNLVAKYRTQAEQIEHWWNVCRTQFPIYLDYWRHHPDMTRKTPVYQEQVFRVPYTLPSGITVDLRGKWDAVDLVRDSFRKKDYLWIQENKSKGDIKTEQISNQLERDLQSMFYIIALETHQKDILLENNLEKGFGDCPIAGVRYNVIRRPLSGGKYTIIRHKPTKKNPAGESSVAYYERLAGLIATDPAYFFVRWNVTITNKDIAEFKHQCLNPILQQLVDWYQYVTTHEDPFSPIHWIHPYGVYNVLNEGGKTDLDGYLKDGCDVGLETVTSLFGELE